MITRSCADRPADGQTNRRADSDKLTKRLITGQKDRQKERAERGRHAYVWTNRWIDSLNRQTDRQMVLLSGKALMKWTNTVSDCLTEVLTETLMGYTKWGDRKMNRLDILM